MEPEKQKKNRNNVTNGAQAIKDGPKAPKGAKSKLKVVQKSAQTKPKGGKKGVKKDPRLPKGAPKAPKATRKELPEASRSFQKPPKSIQ